MAAVDEGVVVVSARVYHRSAPLWRWLVSCRDAEEVRRRIPRAARIALMSGEAMLLGNAARSGCAQTG